MYPCNGMHYILLITDVFSGRIWTYPLQSKDTQTMQKTFEKFLNELHDVPTQLSTDQGT